jgi:beta-lactamase superfamily II metal-dependent hydrolase
MTVEIFDVGHGACAVVTAPNGNRLMIDCGHSNERPWRPSEHYAGAAIHELVVSNYDEDHVSDLVGVMAKTKVAFITRNTSVGPESLGHLKMEYGMGVGIGRLHRWMHAVQGRPSGGSPDFGPMRRASYWNSYPNDFDDENNLSILTIVEWAGFRMSFAGDLEDAGWERLLRRQSVRDELAGVDVFVASHHGRESGCCDEVFTVCNPQVVVISDRDHQFDTQATTPWYADRCKGINFNRKKRHVFTTRCDGDMKFSITPEAKNLETQFG